MKKIIVYSVKLQDYRDFSFLPGAKEFQSKYSPHEQQYSFFHFDMQHDNWSEVEKDLQISGLSYSKHYQLALDGKEIADHPAHYLTIPALYDLVTGEDRELTISSEIWNTPMAQDFQTEVVVALMEVVEVLTRLNPRIKAGQDRVFKVKKKNYQILGDLPQLDAPILILHATGVKEISDEQQSTFRTEGWDGRSSLSDSAVDFVKSQHLVAARSFAFENAQYRQNVPNYLISGELANFLHKKFKEQIQITPMTFDTI